MARTTVLLFAAAVAAAQPLRGEMILSNSGFETGSLDEWQCSTTGAGSYWQITSDETHSGQYAAQLVGSGEITRQFGPYPASQVLEMSFWIRPDSATLGEFFAYCSADVRDENGQPLATAYPIEAWTLDWQQQGQGGGAIPGWTVWSLTVGGSDFHIDDIRIAIVPEPTTATLLAAGVLAAVCRRRRRRRR